MILVFLTGGLSHLDSLDMKPDAPDGIRGEFRPIATRVPGIQVCEHLPELAARAEKLAIVRSLSHTYTNHLNATHELLTGHAQPGAFFDKIASRDDYPCYASGLDAIRPRGDGIPSGVTLPTFLMEGPLVWPGQHAGFLGPRHDPWQIRQDPNRQGFRVDDGLSLPPEFSVQRIESRQTLLAQFQAQRDALEGRAARGADPLSEQRQRAMSLLLSGKVSRGLRPGAEKIRGSAIATAATCTGNRSCWPGGWSRPACRSSRSTWDGFRAGIPTRPTSRRSRSGSCRQPTAASRHCSTTWKPAGLLDETLVVVTGEFGRTPRIGASTGNNNTRDGRDHWAAVFSAALAGGGVQGGQTIGRSDKIGAYPASRPYTPADLAATIYQSLGIDPATEVRDRLNRPVRLCTGEPIAPVFSAARAVG